MIGHSRGIKIFTGNSNPQLAKDICKDLGIPLGSCEVGSFADGENFASLYETVRGADVFVVQSTCSFDVKDKDGNVVRHGTVNDALMELLIMIDALRRASAGRITAVIPYFGYARQDRKASPRAPISAKLVSDFLTVAGAQRIVTVDLHAGQIQGFFNCPVDNLYARPVLLKQLSSLSGDIVMVSPDAGGVERARSFAKKMDASLAVIDKRRDRPNQVAEMHIVGNVAGKTAVLVDDMIDTAGTICTAANLLMEGGAKEVYACASHAVLSGPALERLNAAPFKEIIVTDTIPLGDRVAECDKIRVASIAGVLAKSIRNIHDGSSVSALF